MNARHVHEAEKSALAHMISLVYRHRGRASSIFLSSCTTCSVIFSIQMTIPPLALRGQARGNSWPVPLLLPSAKSLSQ
jgi:hypothetical protein